MKKIILILIVTVFVSLNLGVIAQPPPPPADPTGGGTNPPVGGGAPIGRGITLLIGLAGIYGAKKFFDARRELNKQED